MSNKKIKVQDDENEALRSVSRNDSHKELNVETVPGQSLLPITVPRTYLFGEFNLIKTSHRLRFNSH